MSPVVSGGHIELDRTIESIVIGHRHRRDLGDIDALAASIERMGLLQPPTLTPDGVLVCGTRRIAALKKLGRKTVNVWVRSGISDRLGQLMAEQDENTQHKPLTPTEAAGLYRELKAVMAEEAARRQEASRFTAAGQNRRSDGRATVAPPSQPSAGKTREQAAFMVTGRKSYTTLERVSELQRLAADQTQPAAVRERAARELEQVDAGGSIKAAHQRVQAEMSLGELERLAEDPSQPASVRDRAAREALRLRRDQVSTRAHELERLATEALKRARTASRTKTRPRPMPVTDAPPARYTLRAFLLTWADLADWHLHYDPVKIGPALTEEQWQQFEATVAATVAFAHRARAARAARAAQHASA